jgi:hypothetical protein
LGCSSPCALAQFGVIEAFDIREVEMNGIKRIARIFIFVGSIVLLGGCNGADPVAVIQPAADVHCEQARVWAGAAESDPLPEMASCGPASGWQGLAAGGWVTTDDDGEAWLDINGCQTIYLYQRSDLRKSSCSGASGSAVCSISGTSAYNNSCSSEVIIETPTSRVNLAGTWVAITYLEDLQLSLISVFDGAAFVEPVLEIEQGRLGDPIEVKANQFIFTAPDDRARNIADLPVREPISFDELGRIVTALQIEPWYERVFDQAITDEVLDQVSGLLDPSSGEPPDGVGGLEIWFEGGGAALEDLRVQEAVLRSVPYLDLIGELFPEQERAFIWDVGAASYEGNIELDQDKALVLLEEAGYSGDFFFLLIYSRGDKNINALAGSMVDWLSKVRIGVEQVEAGSPEEADKLINTFLDNGDAVIWLNTR